jgi:hypothetical protein
MVAGGESQLPSLPSSYLELCRKKISLVHAGRLLASYHLKGNVSAVELPPIQVL